MDVVLQWQSLYLYRTTEVMSGVIPGLGVVTDMHGRFPLQWTWEDGGLETQTKQPWYSDTAGALNRPLPTLLTYLYQSISWKVFLQGVYWSLAVHGCPPRPRLSLSRSCTHCPAAWVCPSRPSECLLCAQSEDGRKHSASSNAASVDSYVQTRERGSVVLKIDRDNTLPIVDIVACSNAGALVSPK